MVKLLVPEPGTDEVRELWRDADELVTATVAYVEVHAALARRLPARRAERARRAFAARWREILTIDVDDALVAEAGTTATRFRLTALDAVHLAAAHHARRRDFLFVTWDEELRRAARATGIAVAPA